jgi:membrane protein DedA with SNARE-associated domain
MFTGAELTDLIREHGLLAIGVLTTLESMGVPAPGESAVIAAALYAAETHQIGILPLIGAAAFGAILGDNIGYVVGRQIGYRLIAKFGRHVGLTERRIRLGRYLFECYGSKVVFFGRFVAILRTFTALLAGANHMDWRRFALYNALGGILWATLYGGGAYLLGRQVKRLELPVAIGFGVVALVVAGVLIHLTRKHGERLQEEADRAYPDDKPQSAAA